MLTATPPLLADHAASRFTTEPSASQRTMSTEKAPIAADEAQAWPELPDVDTAKMPEIATIVREQYLILGAIARAKPKFADDLALTLAKLRSMVMHLQIIFPTATPLVEVRYLITPDLMQEIRLATKDVVARVELMKGPTTTLTSGLRKAQVDPVQNAVIALESAIVTFKDLHQA